MFFAASRVSLTGRQIIVCKSWVSNYGSQLQSFCRLNLWKQDLTLPIFYSLIFYQALTKYLACIQYSLDLSPPHPPTPPKKKKGFSTEAYCLPKISVHTYTHIYKGNFLFGIAFHILFQSSNFFPLSQPINSIPVSK